MSIRYEALQRVKEILERTAYNYKPSAPCAYTARGCAKYLEIARLLNGFAKELDDE